MKRIRKYGLIGYPLSHSFSPKYFAEKYEKEGILDAQYRTYPIENIDQINLLIKEGLIGFNVTIPYKEQIIPYLDDMTDAVRKIGAVNTVKIEHGKLVGYNTDVYGLQNSIHTLLDGACVDKALILGTGGAAKACVYILDEMVIEYSLVSRLSPYLTYEEITPAVLDEHKLIINTTPLGMTPNIDSCANIPYEFLDESYFVLDLIYNPKKTLFLKQAEGQGAKILNGLSMLNDQADKSWEVWTREENDDL